jgi:hypothetical protein
MKRFDLSRRCPTSASLWQTWAHIKLSFTLLAALLLATQPAYCYLPTLAAANAPVRWSLNAFPIQYNINPQTSGSKVSGSRSVTEVIQAAFATWTSAPNVNLPVTQGTNTSVSAEASSPSNINLICFICTDADFNKDVQTLAVTLFTFATAPGQSNGHGGTSQFAGQMLKADILFNPASTFTTDGASATGSAIDLQTVATHEIGHFFGLDHSAVVNSMMFPFSPSIRQTLAWDDVAGISALYPGTQAVPVGSLQGTVRLQAGAAVFGAHVFADSLTDAAGYGGNIRKGPIGMLTDAGGNYVITGLPVDSYSVTAEPLDGPVSNDDVSDYPKLFGQTAVQTNFTTRQH